MSIQDMEDLKKQYLDEMKTLINGKDYCNGRIDIEIKIGELKQNFNGMSIEIRKMKKELLQQEQTAYVSTSQWFNFIYDDDDDEESSIPLSDVISELPPCIAITPVLSTNLVPIPSESEEFFDIKSECDVPDCDDSQTTNFSTFSNPLFDDSTSSDDESSHEEFAVALITIPPRIFNREHEEYISLLERLLYDNSSPRLPKDFHAIPNTIIESLPTFPIPVEDSDSLMEEINIFPGPNDSIPSSIKIDDYDSEGDDNSTSLPEFESFHDDYPDSGDSTIDVVEDIPVDVPNISPTIPPFIWILTSFLLIMILDPILIFLTTLSLVIDTLLPSSSKNEDKVFNHGVLASEEKSPPSSSHRGFKAFQLISESPMMIHGENTPNLGDCPDFEASRARGFCPSITRASHPQLHFGNPIS
ncbi:hypothetical protein Tco_0741798 [Tanacetum coccineum]